jgi:hypothetical protein
MIVPDSKPPFLLLGAGALLLSGLVIHTLRRLRRRGSSRASRQGSSQGAIVLGSWRTAVPQGAAPVEALALRALPEPVATRTRLKEGAQNRGRAAKKRP